MLEERFVSVSRATDQDQYRREIVKFAEGLGFGAVAAIVGVDQPSGETRFASICNTPVHHVESLLDRKGARTDPVSQHCKRSSVPIVWDQATYERVGLTEQWESQARYGYFAGIAVAMHLPRGLHFMMSMDCDRSLPSCSKELSRIAAEIVLFATHAQEAAFELLLPLPLEQNLLLPTPRELECLRWTMEGKTAWEIGKILGISEQTAARHLCRASAKLDCVNKHQAVLKALRLGLIR